MPVISGSDSRSGYLSLPPRVQLRERDSATGSYPTIARTGDPDFSGNKPVKFDDTRTVIFSDNVTVSYPTLLEPTGQYLKFITESVATPNTTPDILATGTVRKGIADQFAFFDNSENIGPFKEHQRVLPNSGAFYLTGTDPNVLPGFSNRLSSKTIIKIPLTVLTESSVFFSTGSVPNALGTNQGVNSGLSYFNFVTGKWDVVGVDASTTTGSAVDYLNPDDATRTATYKATANLPTDKFPLFSQQYRAMGSVTSVAGFPFAQKFQANANQTCRLSDYINAPFAIEKVLFTFSGSMRLQGFLPPGQFGPTPNGLNGQRASFFVMNQFRTSSVPTTEITNAYYNSTTSTGVNFVSTFTTDYQRDIVTQSRIQYVLSNSNPPVLDTEDFLVDYQYVRTVSQDPTFRLPIVGSFQIPGVARVPGSLTSSLYHSASAINGRTGDNKVILNDYVGGRGGTGFGSSAFRSLIKPFTATRVISSTLAGGIDFKTVEESTTKFDSPYVVFPEDELVFALANQPVPSLAGQEDDQAENKITVAPGESYILLIGSQIRDGKEFHDTSNQPLNSDAIHEALHFDNPTIDQFQVEALTSYSGTYIDDIVSGDFTAGTRGIVGSVAAGTQGLTGSLLRGVRAVDRAERYYDTVLPSLKSYLTNPVDGYTALQIDQLLSVGSSGIAFPIMSPVTDYSATTFNPDFLAATTSSIASSWYQSFPFEPKYSNLIRNTSQNFLRDLQSDFGKTPYFLLYSTASTVSVVSASDGRQIGEDENQLLRFFFGYGSGFTSSSISEPIASSTFYPNLPNLTPGPKTSFSGIPLNSVQFAGIEGFKYGVKNAVPEFSTVVTRYDRYGQFRDMLEQRPDSSFSTGESITDSPIQIVFVDRDTDLRVLPTATTSSNKSQFATSSLPYFDGVARN